MGRQLEYFLLLLIFGYIVRLKLALLFVNTTLEQASVVSQSLYTVADPLVLQLFFVVGVLCVQDVAVYYVSLLIHLGVHSLHIL